MNSQITMLLSGLAIGVELSKLLKNSDKTTFTAEEVNNLHTEALKNAVDEIGKVRAKQEGKGE